MMDRVHGGGARTLLGKQTVESGIGRCGRCLPTEGKDSRVRDRSW
jgi:hypothetical protein